VSDADDDQSELLTAMDGFVPGGLLGAGGGLLLGVLSDSPGGVAAFVGGAGVLLFVFGGLARLTADSVADASLGTFAGDQEFDAAAARRTGLRLAGLGLGLALGAAVTYGVLA
jgi:hypothetical protein